MKPRAFCMIRDLPHYRCGSFVAGLEAAGYAVRKHVPLPADAGPDDALVIWNRYGQHDQLAKQADRQGCAVIVAENGYIGKDENGIQRYSLALDRHNGWGRWAQGDTKRWPLIGVEVKPWREPKPRAAVVIRGQRGIGSPGVASPTGWHVSMERKLHEMTLRPIRVVPHPGATATTDTSHERYLQDAHALIIWSSSVGVKALVMGVPVIAASPSWICKSATATLAQLEDEAALCNAKREEALERMAWAQWTLAEIATGGPFALLRGVHQQTIPRGVAA